MCYVASIEKAPWGAATEEDSRTKVMTCSTCHGEGTIFDDAGPQRCPDCSGLGALPSGAVLNERRLRDLEERYSAKGGEVWRDVRWLVGENRRAYHALMQILAASQDAPGDDALIKKIRFLANDVTATYPPVPPAKTGGVPE